MSSDRQTQCNSRNLVRVSSSGYRENIADQLAAQAAVASLRPAAFGKAGRQSSSTQSSFALLALAPMGMGIMPLGLARTKLLDRLQ